MPNLPTYLHNGSCERTAIVVHGIGHSVKWLGGRGGSAMPEVVRIRPETGAREGADEEDARLVERSRVDAEAFGILYDRYCGKIYRFVHRRLGDHAVAEDVTADVFLKALRAIDTYRPDAAPFSAWLYRIATNTVIDHARARRLTRTLDEASEEADRDAPVEEQVINRVEAARVWQAIDALTEAQRTAVTLRYGQDLAIAVIAARMGRTEGAVKLLLNRGLAAVRERLRATEAGATEPGATDPEATDPAGEVTG